MVLSRRKRSPQASFFDELGTVMLYNGKVSCYKAQVGEAAYLGNRAKSR